jgi:DNA-binding NarL/FixJ family response regulator
MAQLLAFDVDPRMSWDAASTLGHDIAAFTDSGEALDHARSHTIDIALLGGAEGVDLIKHLREISPSFKVVLFFDSPRIEELRRALGFAPCSILFKPLVVEELDACLKRALLKGKSTIKGALAL